MCGSARSTVFRSRNSCRLTERLRRTHQLLLREIEALCCESLLNSIVCCYVLLCKFDDFRNHRKLLVLSHQLFYFFLVFLKVYLQWVPATLIKSVVNGLYIIQGLGSKSLRRGKWSEFRKIDGHKFKLPPRKGPDTAVHCHKPLGRPARPQSLNQTV